MPKVTVLVGFPKGAGGLATAHTETIVIVEAEPHALCASLAHSLIR